MAKRLIKVAKVPHDLAIIGGSLSRIQLAKFLDSGGVKLGKDEVHYLSFTVEVGVL